MLSAAAHKTLARMKTAEDADELADAEIVCEGRECWIGLTKIARRTLNELLRLCLVHDDSEQGKGVERYTLNSEGRAMVADPNYVPMIAKLLTGDGDEK
jgi:hypothetical protein